MTGGIAVRKGHEPLALMDPAPLDGNPDVVWLAELGPKEGPIVRGQPKPRPKWSRSSQSCIDLQLGSGEKGEHRRAESTTRRAIRYSPAALDDLVSVLRHMLKAARRIDHVTPEH